MLRILALTSFLAATPLAAQSTWDEYRPSTLARVIRSEGHEASTDPAADGTGNVSLVAAPWKLRVTVVSTGEHRPLSEGAQKVLRHWAVGVAHDSTIPARFTNEYRFVENGTSYWLPIQKLLEPALAEEVEVNGRVTLLVRWIGVVHRAPRPQWVFVVNEFEEAPPKAPPSQWELNGFLIGQHVSALDSALGAPWRVLPAQDGGSDRVYIIDRARGSYMAFHFDSAPAGIAQSVQISGPKGTTMRPFLGITLGTTVDTLVARFGRSTWVTHEDDVQVDLHDWADRNYSFEVDSTGHVNSIRIGGPEGLREQPLDSEPDPLESLRGALTAGTADALIDVVAPDLEISGPRGLILFRQAPRTELGDPRSAMRIGLGKVAQGIRNAPDRAPLRVLESREMMLVRQWDAGPVQELVFRWFPGGFRLWEAKLR